MNNDPSILEQMRPVKQENNNILSEEIEKRLQFMKQKYYKAGTKASKLLAWRLRKQQAEHTIHQIREPSMNKITTKLEGIQKAFEKY